MASDRSAKHIRTLALSLANDLEAVLTSPAIAGKGRVIRRNRLLLEQQLVALRQAAGQTGDAGIRRSLWAMTLAVNIVLPSTLKAVGKHALSPPPEGWDVLLTSCQAQAKHLSTELNLFAEGRTEGDEVS